MAPDYVFRPMSADDLPMIRCCNQGFGAHPDDTRGIDQFMGIRT